MIGLNQNAKNLECLKKSLQKKVGYKSRSSVNKIETDGRGLPQNKIVMFAKALQTSPAYLMAPGILNFFHLPLDYSLRI